MVCKYLTNKNIVMKKHCRLYKVTCLSLAVMLCHLAILLSWEVPHTDSSTSPTILRVRFDIHPPENRVQWMHPFVKTVPLRTSQLHLEKRSTTPAPVVLIPGPQNTSVLNSDSGELTPSDEPFVAVSPTHETLPSEPTVELLSSDADYLNNFVSAYPALSQRLGEQGRVVVHVLIGKDGIAESGKITQSSGYDRLDQAALRTALSRRYRPSKKAGIAQDIELNVPIIFVLN
jgi:protein TonB